MGGRRGAGLGSSRGGSSSRIPCAGAEVNRAAAPGARSRGRSAPKRRNPPDARSHTRRPEDASTGSPVRRRPSDSLRLTPSDRSSSRLFSLASVRKGGTPTPLHAGRGTTRCRAGLSCATEGREAIGGPGARGRCGWIVSLFPSVDCGDTDRKAFAHATLSKREREGLGSHSERFAAISARGARAKRRAAPRRARPRSEAHSRPGPRPPAPCGASSRAGSGPRSRGVPPCPTRTRR